MKTSPRSRATTTQPKHVTLLEPCYYIEGRRNTIGVQIIRNRKAVMQATWIKKTNKRGKTKWELYSYDALKPIIEPPLVSRGACFQSKEAVPALFNWFWCYPIEFEKSTNKTMSAFQKAFNKFNELKRSRYDNTRA